MKKTLIFFIIFLALIGVGCKKDAESVMVAVLPAEVALLQKIQEINNAAGSVFMASKFQFNRKTTAYQVDASFKAGQIYDHVKVDGISLKPFNPGVGYTSNQYIPDGTVSNQQFATLFGKKVDISLESPGSVQPRNENAGSITTSMEMDLGILSPSGTMVTPGSTIPRDVPLNWTPDPNNRNVYILVSFNPEYASNRNFRSSPRVDKFYQVRDNGSYTIPASAFAGIPNGAYFDILIARGTSALIGGNSNGSGGTSMSSFAMATIVAFASGDTGCPGGCIEVMP